MFLLIDAVTLISVNCSNWTDPDDSLQTFVYLYETVIRRNLTHGIDDIVSIVYEGSMYVTFSSDIRYQI